jgi:ribosomal-protein-alanine N-acetyltransferase
MPSPIVVRHPERSDRAEFVAAALRSGQLHRPWVTAPSTDDGYRRYLRHLDRESTWGFLICRRDTGTIAGVINVSNAVRGVFQSAYLGYYAFEGHEHQGLMREGLKAVVRHSFRTLKLHRLEANVQPDNLPSIALVRSCGFAKEGFSPRYLKVRGKWRDHERWAILAS